MSEPAVPLVLSRITIATIKFNSRVKLTCLTTEGPDFGEGERTHLRPGRGFIFLWSGNMRPSSPLGTTIFLALAGIVAWGGELAIPVGPEDRRRRTFAHILALRRSHTAETVLS